MKCMPMTLSGRRVAAPSRVIEIEEVFEARIVSGGVIPSSTLEEFSLDAQIFGDCFDYKSGLAERFEFGSGYDPSRYRNLFLSAQASLVHIALQALINRCQAALQEFVLHVTHNDIVAGPRAATCAMPLPMVPEPTTPMISAILSKPLTAKVAKIARNKSQMSKVWRAWRLGG